MAPQRAHEAASCDAFTRLGYRVGRFIGRLGVADPKPIHELQSTEVPAAPIAILTTPAAANVEPVLATPAARVVADSQGAPAQRRSARGRATIGVAANGRPQTMREATPARFPRETTPASRHLVARRLVVLRESRVAKLGLRVILGEHEAEIALAVVGLVGLALTGNLGPVTWLTNELLHLLGLVVSLVLHWLLGPLAAELFLAGTGLVAFLFIRRHRRALVPTRIRFGPHSAR
jgi:hypothetical protein